MRLRFWLGTALAAVLLVVGVQGVAQATSGSVANKPLAFTAAEYFDGIYFGVGPVADRVPQLHDERTSVDPAEAARVAAELRAHIDAESPRYIATFAATMVSGDHVAIRDALTDGAERLADAYTAVYPDGLDAVPAAPCNPLGCALAVALAVVVWIAVYLAEWKWGPGDGMLPEGNGDLLLDEAADTIATELALR